MRLRFADHHDLTQVAPNPGMRLLILGLVFLATCTSCSRSQQKTLLDQHSVQFFAPTKDDVLWVDGRRLSILGYHALREHLPSTLTQEQVLWIATAALALQNDALPKGIEIPLRVAVQEAMMALEDPATKNQLEKTIAQATVQRNPQVLAELR